MKLIFLLLLLISFALPVAANDLPKMEVTGLVVFNAKDYDVVKGKIVVGKKFKNIAIINDRIYYKGDYIEVMKDGSMNSIVPGGRVKVVGTLVKVEKIDVDGVKLSVGGDMFLLKMKAKGEVKK